MATGESMPVSKGPGDEVIGATVNQTGLLQVQATRVGKDTFLAQVIKLVEEAQGTKVPIQAFADRVTAVFVPVVMGIAVLTLLLWVAFGGSLRAVLVAAQGVLPWVNPDTFGGDAGDGGHHLGAGHRLPLRSGPGHAHGADGGQRHGGGERHPHPQWRGHPDHARGQDHRL